LVDGVTFLQQESDGLLAQLFGLFEYRHKLVALWRIALVYLTR